jgi:hypothetical protein
MILNNISPDIKKLNELYQKILGRDVDQAGIRSYLHMIKEPNGEIKVSSILRDSPEYREKNNMSNTSKSFNSMAGDRKSYINSNDTKIIDNSIIGGHIENILKLMILLDCEHYNATKLKNRLQTAKESLVHIGQNNLPFTVFPHMEYFYNTEKLESSLRDIKNFQYYVLYLTLSNLWKVLFGKTVATCGTKEFVETILNNKCYSFEDIYKNICDYTTNYFSIKICGHLLSDDKKSLLCNFILEKKPDLYFDYLYDIRDKYIEIENKKISDNIAAQTKKLGRKPSVLIMVAYLETQNRYFIEKTLYHANKVKELNPSLDIDFAFDNERIGKEKTDYTPWSRVKRIRNLMIEKYPIKQYDYLYIIDSDIIDYPHDFLSRAIGLNPQGITAPLALIQNSITFYDWCGYQKLGATNPRGKFSKCLMNKSAKERNFNLKPPYTDSSDRLEEIDCVGCTYVVPTYVFFNGYGKEKDDLLYAFELAKVKNHKIPQDTVQYEDHPTFTDHYTICMATRSNGAKVMLDKGSSAYHADLPLFGENWH